MTDQKAQSVRNYRLAKHFNALESNNVNVVVGILLDDASGVFVRVERVHEDERHVGVVRRVEVLFRHTRRINRGTLLIR